MDVTYEALQQDRQLPGRRSVAIDEIDGARAAVELERLLGRCEVLHAIARGRLRAAVQSCTWRSQMGFCDERERVQRERDLRRHERIDPVQFVLASPLALALRMRLGARRPV